MLRVWNAVLVAGAFSLSLFGTFLTRSGVINSIHSFTQSSIGAWFLGFIALVAARFDGADPLSPAAAPLAHAARVARLPRGRLPLQQPLPRRLRADRPLGGDLPAGLGGRARRRAHRRRALLRLLRHRLRAPARPAHGRRPADRLEARIATGSRPFAALAGRRRARRRDAPARSPEPARARPGSSATRSRRSSSRRSSLEFVRGTRARHALGGGSWLSAFTSLVGRNRRRYGGYVVHAAIVLLLVGAVGIGGFGTTREAKLAQGQSLQVGDYTLTYLGSEQQRAANAQRASRSPGTSRAAGRTSGRWSQARTATSRSSRRPTRSRFVPTGCGQKTSSSSPTSSMPTARSFVKVLVNPLVNLIWLAGLLFVAGSLITLWPDAREQRRLARRFAEEGALARACDGDFRRPPRASCSPSQRSPSWRVRSSSSRRQRTTASAG